MTIVHGWDTLPIQFTAGSGNKAVSKTASGEFESHTLCMQVLLQKNIFHEHEYGNFVENLKKMAITQEVNVIPFTNEIDGPVYVKPDYCFGSTRFIDICRERGYPVFKSFGPIDPIYEGHYLNDEGWDCKLGEIDFRGHKEVFVKPHREKFFTGTVINPVDLFDRVQLCFSEGENEKEELVRVSPVVQLMNEVRLFVIDGEIITGSLYRSEGRAERMQVTSQWGQWKFAQQLINERGVPDEAFVMDIGLTHPLDDVPCRIVELNNFNSSGFYKSDLSLIIGHLANRKKKSKVVDKPETV